jgi:CRISPR-associated protein Cmr2
MSSYLIALSIGPVQGFIAAARKTRDLWFGSYVLSEVSKAVAEAFCERKAKLIFPAPEKCADLTDLNVANKLLVQVEAADAKAVEDLLKTAKNAAQARWRKLAEEAKNKLPPNAVRDDIWNKQLNDVLELFGAWVQVTDYHTARDRVDTLLAARKSLRNFTPAAKAFNEAAYFGLPKSSLDAARETVLKDKLGKKARRKLGLGENEQLDCPGVVKRLGGDTEQFPPVTRIALETWLGEIPQEALQEINAQYEILVRHDLATRVRPHSVQFAKLPYDGGLLFPDRIAAERQKLDVDEVEALEALKQLEKARKVVCKAYGEPESYYAVLVADGDKMGAYLDSCKTLEEHQAVSRALDEFARNAPGIVTQHQGACVYAGGDDVMALLPIHTAVTCADKLRQAFEEAVEKLPGNREKPTLSVGLGLAHVMTPFSVALDVGRRAEKLAKAKDKKPEEQGNALALIADVRSGAELSVRGQWQSEIVADLERWRQAYKSGDLPATVPYELRAAIERVEWAKHGDDFITVARQEISRVLKKKRESGGDKAVDIELIKALEKKITSEDRLETLLQQLRIARWLAGKHKE